MLISIVVFFALFIFFLLKLRKNLLANDLKISARDLKSQLKDSPQPVGPLIYSIRQDKSNRVPLLLVRNQSDEILAQIEFMWGFRKHRAVIDQKVYWIKNKWVWGGTHLSLCSEDEIELACLVRSSFKPIQHRIDIPGFGTLNSKSGRSIFDLKMAIDYQLENQWVGHTEFISSTRRIGRVGYFSDQISIPVQIFVLAMTS